MNAERVYADQTSTFPRFLDLAYPSVERGDGVWLFTTGGEKILDACSGGAMVANLGHGPSEVIDAGAKQSEKIAYFYMDHFTNEPQERLADRLISVAPGMARVRFASSGSEANETALRLARAFHVDRGEPDRWRVISPAQAYHGSTMATLALTGRKHTIQEPYSRYLTPHLHISPSTWRFDPSGQAALDPGLSAEQGAQPPVHDLMVVHHQDPELGLAHTVSSGIISRTRQRPESSGPNSTSAPW